MNITLYQLQWCAEECERQKSGELSVLHMANALLWAKEERRGSDQLTVDFILGIQSKVEPNHPVFRVVPVTFGGLVGGAKATEIPRLVEQLVDAWNESRVDAQEFYHEFEAIHPFEDGNGRTGAILYNCCRQRLDYPLVPPEFTRKE